MRLRKILPEDLSANIYKLGGDDFGVLFEGTQGYKLGDLAKKIINGIGKMILYVKVTTYL